MFESCLGGVPVSCPGIGPAGFAGHGILGLSSASFLSILCQRKEQNEGFPEEILGTQMRGQESRTGGEVSTRTHLSPRGSPEEKARVPLPSCPDPYGGRCGPCPRRAQCPVPGPGPYQDPSCPLTEEQGLEFRNVAQGLESLEIQEPGGQSQGGAEPVTPTASWVHVDTWCCLELWSKASPGDLRARIHHARAL